MSQERYAMAGCGFGLPGDIDKVDGSCHEIRWQPKFADPASAVTSIDLDQLTGTLRGTGPVTVRVAEFAQNAEPGQTAVGPYLSDAVRGDVEFALRRVTLPGRGETAAAGITRSARGHLQPTAPDQNASCGWAEYRR
jgi:hypothetical protein